MKNTKITNLEMLINETKAYLKEVGYSSGTVSLHSSLWKKLSLFLAEKNVTVYEPINGLDFLHQEINYPEILKRGLTPRERSFIRSVRFLNAYQKNGTLPTALSRKHDAWDEGTEKLKHDFINFCNTHLNAKHTIKTRLYAAERFIQHIIINENIDVDKITSHTISEYVFSLSEYSKATVVVHLVGLKFFFKFLYEKGYIKTELESSIPHFHGSTGEKIPHVLSQEDVKMLLASIDRGNPIGKRNYAILLMAALLGMRDSDITNLTFENLDWDNCWITFFQKKTKRFVKLPLLSTVGEAIVDYLKNGRPLTKSHYVFVKHRAPFEQATSFYNVMAVCLADSGIVLNRNISRGLHILRHTLASELIRQGEAYNTISAILGHSSLGATDTYAHIDLDGLLKCALELTEVCVDDEV